MDVLSSFPKPVIKIEGKYDIVIKDDELEGTVVLKDWSLCRVLLSFLI